MGAMAPIAFVSSFAGLSLPTNRCESSKCVIYQRLRRTRTNSLRHRVSMGIAGQQRRDIGSPRQSGRPHRVIGIVGNSKSSEKINTEVGTDSKGGLFGMKANAYWESMGAVPLFFAGFGVVALGIKMLKVKSGEMRSGPSGINKVTIPKTAITSEAEEAELHVFKCGGCGYEMYPARGREFKFFPDSFKCPLCATPKSEFWDLNDPDDPRNQEDEEEDDVADTDGVDDDPGQNGTKLSTTQDPSDESDGAESATTTNAEQDTSM